MATSFKISKQSQREFDETLERYRKLSKKSFPEIVNRKALFIARGALYNTGKSKKQPIRSFFNTIKNSEIMGKMINKRRAAHGEKGLYGKEMAEAAHLIYRVRTRSIAFIKSGWIPAIKALSALVPSTGAKRFDKDAVQVGVAKGSVRSAKASLLIIKAIITNSANARHDHTEATEKYGAPALEKAFDDEVASMKVYIENKMRTDAKNAGIKTEH